MKAVVIQDTLLQDVKVWLWNDTPGGRIYMWPVEINEYGHMSWYQEIVPNDQAPPSNVRPALEMSRPIWEAFVAALRDAEGLIHTVDDTLYAVLKREQARVDVLINALINMHVPVSAVLETIGPPTAYSDGGGASYGSQ